MSEPIPLSSLQLVLEQEPVRRGVDTIKVSWLTPVSLALPPNVGTATFNEATLKRVDYRGWPCWQYTGPVVLDTPKAWRDWPWKGAKQDDVYLADLDRNVRELERLLDADAKVRRARWVQEALRWDGREAAFRQLWEAGFKRGISIDWERHEYTREGRAYQCEPLGGIITAVRALLAELQALRAASNYSTDNSPALGGGREAT